jgi:hypothetical protein
MVGCGGQGRRKGHRLEGVIVYSLTSDAPTIQDVAYFTIVHWWLATGVESIEDRLGIRGRYLEGGRDSSALWFDRRHDVHIPLRLIAVA